MEFYRCELCGNIVVKLVEGAGDLVCCGQEMSVLKAGVIDASLEKHVPSFKVEGDILKVQIGEVVHPMTPEHYIQFIFVIQRKMAQYKLLEPGEAPEAEFKISADKPFEVYEYCILHGLWKAGK